MAKTLIELAGELRDTAALIVRLADIAEETRTDAPVGYRSARPEDGIARPVEDVILGNEARGVTAALDAARSALTFSLARAHDTARSLDVAISRWESSGLTRTEGVSTH